MNNFISDGVFYAIIDAIIAEIGRGGKSLSVEKEKFMEILAGNLSEESKWFLWTLKMENSSLHKEKLRDIANENYREMQLKAGNHKSAPLVQSRHGLDIHTARLEGAGLVSVKEVGRIRMYSLSELGNELLEYVAKKVKSTSHQQ